jgi:hypothetical protein
MGTWFESTASRMTAAFQRIGADVDPDVLAWPGGCFIAASVCLYMRAVDLARGVIADRRIQRP